MKNVFSIDLEDWYQGTGIPAKEWQTFENRLHIGVDKLLHLLQKHKVKATWFTVGMVMDECPAMIKTIAAEGHEIACHSYTHPFLYDITPEMFREELELCQKAAGKLNIKLQGFRAPYFSVDHRSYWVIDLLKEYGYKYDSSIFPGDTKRTGIKNFSLDICSLENGLIEYPITKFKFLNQDVGTGGAYFRIIPYTIFKRKLKQIERSRPINFYMHPWELDPHHPKLENISKRIKYPHYYNLGATERKVDSLLGDFEFTNMSELLKV